MRGETGDGSLESREGDGGGGKAEGVGRRDVLRLLAAAPLAHFAITYESVAEAAELAGEALHQAAQRGQRFQPKFFGRGEWETVRIMADLTIPRDERSGSATDAGVPEFMDFIMTAYPDMQKLFREGLVWIDRAATSQFSKRFVDATAEQQMRLLDQIAYPKRAAATAKPGADFFSRFRNLTASGFWSSKIGIADLQYIGNRAQTAWNGCPPAALAKLGVKYT